MSGHLHPIFVEALRPFVPAALLVPERAPMRAFMVQVIDRKSGTVREAFEAMAPDSITCVQQHMDHALEGEKLDVMSLEAWREQQAQPAPFSEEWLAQADKAVQQRKDSDAARRERECEQMWQQRNVADFIGRGQ